MAMSVTITENDRMHSVKKIKFAVVTAADGSASGTTAYPYDGELIWVATDPGATAPTDDWDFTITNPDGLDLLAGGGANRDTSVTEYIAETNLGAVSQEKLTLTVANGGDSKTLDVYVYIR